MHIPALRNKKVEFLWEESECYRTGRQGKWWGACYGAHLHPLQVLFIQLTLLRQKWHEMATSKQKLQALNLKFHFMSIPTLNMLPTTSQQITSLWYRPLVTAMQNNIQESRKSIPFTPMVPSCRCTTNQTFFSQFWYYAYIRIYAISFSIDLHIITHYRWIPFPHVIALFVLNLTCYSIPY